MAVTWWWTCRRRSSRISASPTLPTRTSRRCGTCRASRLPRLEWQRRADGSLASERTLPNGIAFGANVRPTPTEVRMDLWLRNGTKEKLTGLRVQNCVMLGYAPGFAAQTNTNKVFQPPYAAVRSGGWPALGHHGLGARAALLGQRAMPLPALRPAVSRLRTRRDAASAGLAVVLRRCGHRGRVPAD